MSHICNQQKLLLSQTLVSPSMLLFSVSTMGVCTSQTVELHKQQHHWLKCKAVWTENMWLFYKTFNFHMFLIAILLEHNEMRM